MIVALLIGFLTGWLMSMPIGPVNAAVISRTLKYSWRFGLATATGAAIMDTIYCGGAAQINQFLVESPIINLIFQSIGFLALVFLGIRQLRAKAAEQNPPSEEDDDAAEARAESAITRMRMKKRHYLAPFMLGVLLYATNVAAVAEWIIVAGIWRSWGLLGIGLDINVGFALGAGLGTLGWYVTLIRWIRKRQRGFAPSTLKKINFGTGIAMLVFGAYFGFQIVFGTNWKLVKSHFEHNTGIITHTGS